MYIGPGLNLTPHMNVATTIAVSLAENLALRTWGRSNGWSQWQSASVAVIPSETLHHLVSTGNTVFLYLDPLGDGRLQMSQAQLDSGRARLLREAHAIGVNSAFEAFGLSVRQLCDERIGRVAREIERRPYHFRSLQEAAVLSSLSPSRFRARFVKELGLPFRRYRLWRRMAAVMRAIATGSNLTTAAHQAGFSSSAHLSSAFRQMFGISASEVLALGVAIDLSEDAVHFDAATKELTHRPGLRAHK